MSGKALILIDRLEGVKEKSDVVEYMEQYFELGYHVRVEPIIIKVSNPFGWCEGTT